MSEKRSSKDNEIKISPENVLSHTGQVINFYSDYEGTGSEFFEGDILFNKLRVFRRDTKLMTAE